MRGRHRSFESPDLTIYEEDVFCGSSCHCCRYFPFIGAIAIGRSPLIRGLVDHVGAMKEIRALDNISFKDWFLGKGGSQASLDLMWDAIAYGLGFIDCENISARCMLTIFQFFASRTEASILRMLEGAPDEFLHQPRAQGPTGF